MQKLCSKPTLHRALFDIDMVEEASKMANKCKECADNFEDYRVSEFVDILQEANETLIELANFIESEI